MGGVESSLCLGGSWLAEEKLMGGGHQAQGHGPALLLPRTLPKSLRPGHYLKEGK